MRTAVLFASGALGRQMHNGARQRRRGSTLRARCGRSVSPRSAKRLRFVAVVFSGLQSPKPFRYLWILLEVGSELWWNDRKLGSGFCQVNDGDAGAVHWYALGVSPRGCNSDRGGQRQPFEPIKWINSFLHSLLPCSFQCDGPRCRPTIGDAESTSQTIAQLHTAQVALRRVSRSASQPQMSPMLSCCARMMLRI